MRHDPLERAEKKSTEITRRVLSPDFHVTPSMRQKVEDLAVWLAAGDRRKGQQTYGRRAKMTDDSEETPHSQPLLPERSFLDDDFVVPAFIPPAEATRRFDFLRSLCSREWYRLLVDALEAHGVSMELISKRLRLRVSSLLLSLRI